MSITVLNELRRQAQFEGGSIQGRSMRAAIPTATPITVSAKRRIGSCHASLRVNATTTNTTAVVIEAVMAS